jgi:serine/threonine protein kinase
VEGRNEVRSALVRSTQAVWQSHLLYTSVVRPGWAGEQIDMFSTGAILNGRYELVLLLAEGGMGQVWTAKDILLDRLVAIKCVNPSYLASNAKAIAILQDEARTGARLIGHPNVVCTLDLGIARSPHHADVHYIVLEYVKGASLSSWIVNHSQELDGTTYSILAMYISWEICKSLIYAHSVGIIHRDVKPLNVFLSDIGMTKVGDFGLARFVEAVTRTHTVWKALSPAYAAPEQWRGEKASQRSDIYQIGCTLYQVLTRKLPFEEDGLLALMHAHMNKTVVPVSVQAPSVSTPISDIIGRCLSKDPDARPELWEVFDVFSEELRSRHVLVIDVSKESTQVQDQVGRITDFNMDDLRIREISINFPDFSECMSEAMSLTLLQVKKVKLSKVPVPDLPKSMSSDKPK